MSANIEKSAGIDAAPVAQPAAPQGWPKPSTVKDILEFIVGMSDDAPIRKMAQAGLDALAAPVPAPPAGQSEAEQRAWQEGVLMAASIVIACHDMPVIAATILSELGATTADCSDMDEFDKASLRKVQGELSGAVALRGLDPASSPQAAETPKEPS